MNPPLDIDRQNDVILVLAMGGTMKVAADFIGCTERTLYNNARRDKEFRKRIRRAKADVELSCLKAVRKASHDDQNWRASVQMMKYLDPDRYACKANTMPIKNAEKFMNEFAKLILSFVDNPATMQKIDECLNQSKKTLRDGKTPKQPDSHPHREKPR
jgi:hypothetical protein